MGRIRKRFIWYALVLLAVGCGLGTVINDVSAQGAQRLDEHRYFGTPVRFQNLTVWPIHTDAPHATAAYASLHDAQAKGLATVREKRGADGAAVNEVTIENRGDKPLLVCGGTVIKGGKQDRQIARDVVVPPHATVVVEAFCIERGRWVTEREGQATDGVFSVPKVMAAKRVRVSGQYAGSQSQVWGQVDHVNEKSGKRPATSTFLATVDEDDGAARALRREMAEAVRRHFAALGDSAVGFAYAVNGEPLTIRTFANAELLRGHFEPFVATMSIEAQVAQVRDRGAGREVYDATASLEPMVDMAAEIGKAEPESQRTAGLNRNVYRRNERGGQSSCVVPAAGGEWVPLTEDWTAAAEVRGELRMRLEALDALGYTGSDSERPTASDSVRHRQR